MLPGVITILKFGTVQTGKETRTIFSVRRKVKHIGKIILSDTLNLLPPTTTAVLVKTSWSCCKVLLSLTLLSLGGCDPGLFPTAMWENDRRKNWRELGSYIPIPTEDKCGNYRAKCSCYFLEGIQSAYVTSPTQYILRRTKGGEEWTPQPGCDEIRPPGTRLWWPRRVCLTLSVCPPERVRWTTLQSSRTTQWRASTMGHWQTGQAQASQLFWGADRLITHKGFEKVSLFM